MPALSHPASIVSRRPATWRNRPRASARRVWLRPSSPSRRPERRCAGVTAAAWCWKWPWRGHPCTGVAQPAGPGHSWDQLRARWKVLGEELKRARPATTAALLAEAQPVSCDGQTVVIGFRYSTLRDKWDRGDHKQRLGA